jgi:hypothetical protein
LTANAAALGRPEHPFFICELLRFTGSIALVWYGEFRREFHALCISLRQITDHRRGIFLSDMLLNFGWLQAVLRRDWKIPEGIPVGDKSLKQGANEYNISNDRYG